LSEAVEHRVKAANQKGVIKAECMSAAEAMCDSAKKPAEAKLDREARLDPRYIEACHNEAAAEAEYSAALSDYTCAKLTAEFELAELKAK